MTCQVSYTMGSGRLWLLNNEFIDTNSVKIYIEVLPYEEGTDLPKDIRDIRVLNYIDLLSEKAKHVNYIENVGSATETIKANNNGKILDKPYLPDYNKRKPVTSPPFVTNPTEAFLRYALES